jgi:hypothetical protein
MLVQVVPLFVGYAWFGVMFFAPYLPRFGSFSQAFATLFCVWNGDGLMDVQGELGTWFPGLGFAYLSVFVGVFSYVVLNILLVVVQQTLVYVQVQDRGKRRLHRLLLRREGGKKLGGEGREGGEGDRDVVEKGASNMGRHSDGRHQGLDEEKDFLALLDLTHGQDATRAFFEGESGGRGGGGERRENKGERGTLWPEKGRADGYEGLRQRRGGQGEREGGKRTPAVNWDQHDARSGV